MGEFSSHGGLSRMKRSFKNMQKEPKRTFAELDAAQAQGFAATQAHVHVETSALKFSGRVSSHWGKSAWSGSVSYGGSGVDYAEYEAQRGGTHNFMYPMEAAYVEMEVIIGHMLDGV